MFGANDDANGVFSNNHGTGLSCHDHKPLSQRLRIHAQRFEQGYRIRVVKFLAGFQYIFHNLNSVRLAVLVKFSLEPNAHKIAENS